jgi:hypothetical protein
MYYIIFLIFSEPDIYSLAKYQNENSSLDAFTQTINIFKSYFINFAKEKQTFNQIFNIEKLLNIQLLLSHNSRQLILLGELLILLSAISTNKNQFLDILYHDADQNNSELLLNYFNIVEKYITLQNDNEESLQEISTSMRKYSKTLKNESNKKFNKSLRQTFDINYNKNKAFLLPGNDKEKNNLLNTIDAMDREIEMLNQKNEELTHNLIECEERYRDLHREKEILKENNKNILQDQEESYNDYFLISNLKNEIVKKEMEIEDLKKEHELVIKRNQEEKIRLENSKENLEDKLNEMKSIKHENEKLKLKIKELNLNKEKLFEFDAMVFNLDAKNRQIENLIKEKQGLILNHEKIMKENLQERENFKKMEQEKKKLEFDLYDIRKEFSRMDKRYSLRFSNVRDLHGGNNDEKNTTHNNISATHQINQPLNNLHLDLDKSHSHFQFQGAMKNNYKEYLNSGTNANNTQIGGLILGNINSDSMIQDQSYIGNNRVNVVNNIEEKINKHLEKKETVESAQSPFKINKDMHTTKFYKDENQVIQSPIIKLIQPTPQYSKTNIEADLEAEISDLQSELQEVNKMYIAQIELNGKLSDEKTELERMLDKTKFDFENIQMSKDRILIEKEKVEISKQKAELDYQKSLLKIDKLESDKNKLEDDMINIKEKIDVLNKEKANHVKEVETLKVALKMKGSQIDKLISEKKILVNENQNLQIMNEKLKKGSVTSSVNLVPQGGKVLSLKNNSKEGHTTNTISPKHSLSSENELKIEVNRLKSIVTSKEDVIKALQERIKNLEKFEDIIKKNKKQDNTNFYKKSFEDQKLKVNQEHELIANHLFELATQFMTFKNELLKNVKPSILQGSFRGDYNPESNINFIGEYGNDGDNGGNYENNES